MNLIFIGPQGSGKGTQAKIVAEKLGICHISVGDLLRDVEGGAKKEIESYTLKGKLVPDELVVRILKERIFRSDCDDGFILDGFPRNMRQAEELDEFVDIDKVFEIFISDDEAVKRVLGRLGCLKCGAIYNTYTSPKPRVEGVCDKCGGKLRRRKDDNEKALGARLKIYHKETAPILKRYKSVKVDGGQDIRTVSDSILNFLK